MEENYDVINNYWNENDLMDSVSNINFNCTFTIELHNSNKISSSLNEAWIWIDGGSTHKVQIIDFDGNPRDFPTDFWFSNTIMKNKGKVLTIEGIHPNLGRYTATIICHDKIRK